MTNVQDTINAFMEAAAAHQREPGHLANIQNLQQQLDEAQRHSQELELRLISKTQQIDGLEIQVRSLEVERDDASFRLLETQDKLNTFINDMGCVHASFQSLDETINSHIVAALGRQNPAPSPESVEGQKLQLEAQSPVVVEEPKPAEPPPIEPFVVEPTQEPHPVQATGEPAPKPYEGKRWGDADVYPKPDRGTWLEGGGSEEGYWR